MEYIFLMLVGIAIVAYFLFFHKAPPYPECEHLFFPELENDYLIGQRCALCRQFNTIDVVIHNHVRAVQEFGARKEKAEQATK